MIGLEKSRWREINFHVSCPDVCLMVLLCVVRVIFSVLKNKCLENYCHTPGVVVVGVVLIQKL